VRPPWSIIGRTARAPCLRGPVSSTLGTAMPGLGGTSLLQTRTPSIAVTGRTRVPGLALAGPSSTKPKLKSAALRGILRVSRTRLKGAATRLSSQLPRHLGSPQGSQFHGRPAHELPSPLWPARVGGAGGAIARSSTISAEVGSRAKARQAFTCQAVCQLRTAVPNLSFNRSANGRPPGPARRYAVHCLRPGPGVLPLSPG
jgi:hypothetical protein